MKRARKKMFIFFLVCFVIFLIGCMPYPETHDIDIIQEGSITPLKNNFFHVDEPLIVHVDDELFVVTSDFKTDLASIPRVFWPIVSPSDTNTIYPAILHDFMYSCPPNNDRKFVDDVFFSFLRKEGVSLFRAYEFYFVVRLFGFSHYDSTDMCPYTN